MAKRLFVGNLPYSTNNDSLRELFAQYGEVTTADVIMDHGTGRSKGFGFVEFADDTAADEAIAKTDGSEIEGRRLTVSEARPKAAA